MNRSLRIALIADAFPPLRTSAAVQLRDLSRELVAQGHDVTVILPGAELTKPWLVEKVDGVQVLRLKAPKTKDIGYIRRTLGEFLMPFAMRLRLSRTEFSKRQWDGVIWYTPSIFHGPLANALKRSSRCKAYLIIRDIFPQWAVDMGLMRRGLAYYFFKSVAHYQYSIADVIGVQSPGNCAYFENWRQKSGRQLEVLSNWLGKAAQTRCSIRVNQTSLAGRKVFVYAGNMGIAQGVDIVLDLAEALKDRSDIGFMFVGRGSDAPRLKQAAQIRGLQNVLFFDEIHPDEIPDLYAQCSVGIVALDARHKSHNIPGKFLTYMQSGLPVLANINAGNDLADLIRTEKVGQVCESNQVNELRQLAEKILKEIAQDPSFPMRCQQLFDRQFSAQHAAQQIVRALS